MVESITRKAVAIAVAIAVGGCARPHTAPPGANAASAPSLASAVVMLFPVQDASVPAKNVQHWPADHAALDTELAYWVQQNKPVTRWFLPADIERLLKRSPGLDIDQHHLAVNIFTRAQVKRIGDPLFGDLARLAAVLGAQLAVIPVAAEFVGTDQQSAELNVATVVINATDGTVIWFGVIAGIEKGSNSPAAIASAAQAFARAFGPRKTTSGE